MLILEKKQGSKLTIYVFTLRIQEKKRKIKQKGGSYKNKSGSRKVEKINENKSSFLKDE